MGTETHKGRKVRKHERIKLSWSKSIVNISEGGAYIRTDEPRRLGSKVHFEIKLEPDKPPVRGMGKVIRVIHKKGATKKGDPPGMALEFMDVSSEDRARIRHFVGVQQSKTRV